MQDAGELLTEMAERKERVKGGDRPKNAATRNFPHNKKIGLRTSRHQGARAITEAGSKLRFRPPRPLSSRICLSMPPADLDCEAGRPGGRRDADADRDLLELGVVMPTEMPSRMPRGGRRRARGGVSRVGRASGRFPLASPRRRGPAPQREYAQKGGLLPLSDPQKRVRMGIFDRVGLARRQVDRTTGRDLGLAARLHINDEAGHLRHTAADRKLPLLQFQLLNRAHRSNLVFVLIAQFGQPQGICGRRCSREIPASACEVRLGREAYRMPLGLI